MEYQIEPAKKQAAPVVRFNFMKWSVAAAVIILVASGVWYFAHTRTNDTGPLVVKSPPADNQKKTNNLAPVIANDTPSKQQLAQVNTEPDDGAGKEGQESVESSYKEEMYHYARLVEIKYKEVLDKAGIKSWNALEVMILHLSHFFRHYCAEFLGIQEMKAMLEFMEKSFPDLIREVTSAFATIDPLGVEILTKSVLFTPTCFASSGLISANSSGCSSASQGSQRLITPDR